MGPEAIWKLAERSVYNVSHVIRSLPESEWDSSKKWVKRIEAKFY